jgi:hypothetical protein
MNEKVFKKEIFIECLYMYKEYSVNENFIVI